jgi:hypothetical protein
MMNFKSMMNLKGMSNGKLSGDRYDQMLDRMGLQRKGSASDMMSSIGMFGIGIAVGVTMGMLFAPKRGQEMRSQAKNKIPGMRSKSSGQDQIYEQRA